MDRYLECMTSVVTNIFKAYSGWLLYYREYCKFLILRKFLIPRSCGLYQIAKKKFVNMELFSLFLIVLNTQKIMAEYFKIRERCFSQFYVEIHSSHLIRDLQYCVTISLISKSTYFNYEHELCQTTYLQCTTIGQDRPL